MFDLDVSCYVPVYNGETTIKTCLDSILNQSIKPSKILVINDKSTDNTEKILSEFGDTIEVLNNVTNQGIAYSRNLALRNLKTRFIASVDADVELSKDWLKTLMNIIQEKKITLVGGKMYEKFIENNYNYWRSLRLKQNWGEDDNLNPKFVFGCNNLLDTKFLNGKFKYRTDKEYFKTNAEDIFFSEDLLRNNFKLFYSSQALCLHLQNDNAITLAKRYWRYMNYGDGFKKRNFYKLFKNSLRETKKTLRWSLEDILKLRFRLLKVNFLVLIYFIQLNIKFNLDNK